MHSIDPSSLLLTNGVLSLALTVVLLVSRVGMGEGARGLRTWVVGDLFLAVSRGITGFGLLEPRASGLPGWGFPLESGVMLLLGILLHWHGLNRAFGHDTRWTTVLVRAVGVVLLYGLPALALRDLDDRLRWMDALVMIGAGATLRICWPMRHMGGARLIALTMLLAVIAEATGFIVDSLDRGNDLSVLQVGGLHVGIEPLFIDLLVSLFATTGFLLLMQERLRERIERLVVTDVLTGVLNRRGLTTQLQRELEQFERHGHPLSLVMFDLDHFKRVNDEFGHAVGDRVLSGFAARVTTLMRAGDLLGRWGGEEFVLVLPNTASAYALGVAERMRVAVAETPLAGGAPGVTVSGGVASAAEVSGRSPAWQKLLELADERLYLAKRWRNRLVAASG